LVDPEVVVAHDKLMLVKAGYLNFPFGLLELAIFLIDGIYTDTILLKLFGSRRI
jgi:hypothetical protein